jgi:hypothetical protein
MEIPIACTLSATEALPQLGEWKDLLSQLATGTSRTAPGRLEIFLHEDLTNVAALIHLAQREKACCAFFDFTLVIKAERVTLVVDVPPEASSMLDDFHTSLATSSADIATGEST